VAVNTVGNKAHSTVFTVVDFESRYVRSFVHIRSRVPPESPRASFRKFLRFSGTPDTSRRNLLAQGKHFLEDAGTQVQGEDVIIDISPLVTYAGEGLDAIKGKVLSRSGYVDAIEAFDALVWFV
jgi:hypothetical protein